MKLRCLLVDDEPPALHVLALHISHLSGLEVVGQCKNALEALDVLHRTTVDVIFLDIKMPKILGTEFLRNLSHPPKVIFVTAYRDYAVDGYDLDAIDYLVKPVSFERFVKAVDKIKRLAGQETVKQPNNAGSNAESFVYLKVDRRMHKVFVNDIVYIESWKDYVKLYLTGNKSLFVKQPISSMENLLPERCFMRVHRSYIVSTANVKEYNSLTVQVNDTIIPIGRLYKQAVLERLNDNV